MTGKKTLCITQTILGSLLLVIGFFVLTEESTKMLSGLCIGFGAAMLVLGIGSLAYLFMVPAAKDEMIQRKKTIEVNDERNTSIKEKTGYMVAKTMTYVLLVFILALIFIGADKMVLFMAGALIVIQFVLAVVFSNYYARHI